MKHTITTLTMFAGMTLVQQAFATEPLGCYGGEYQVTDITPAQFATQQVVSAGVTDQGSFVVAGNILYYRAVGSTGVYQVYDYNVKDARKRRNGGGFIYLKEDGRLYAGGYQPKAYPAPTWSSGILTFASWNYDASCVTDKERRNIWCTNPSGWTQEYTTPYDVAAVSVGFSAHNAVRFLSTANGAQPQPVYVYVSSNNYQPLTDGYSPVLANGIGDCTYSGRDCVAYTYQSNQAIYAWSAASSGFGNPAGMTWNVVTNLPEIPGNMFEITKYSDRNEWYGDYVNLFGKLKHFECVRPRG